MSSKCVEPTYSGPVNYSIAIKDVTSILSRRHAQSLEAGDLTFVGSKCVALINSKDFELTRWGIGHFSLKLGGTIATVARIGQQKFDLACVGTIEAVRLPRCPVP